MEIIKVNCISKTINYIKHESQTDLNSKEYFYNSQEQSQLALSHATVCFYEIPF